MAYSKNEWTAADVISEAKLNRIEDQLGYLSDGKLIQVSFSRVVGSTALTVSPSAPLLLGHVHIPVGVGQVVKLKRVRWFRSFSTAFEGLRPVVLPIESFPNEDSNGYDWLEDLTSAECRDGYADRTLHETILDAGYVGQVAVGFYDSQADSYADISCSVWMLLQVE